MNEAAKMWCGPYRAPGYVGMILLKKEQTVPKPEEVVAQKKKGSLKKLKKRKVTVAQK